MREISKTTLRSIYGFTLVELMVVVAVIGILASIAIPNYERYQSKARQVEAKIALAAVYTAEKSYIFESGTYTGCIVDVGYAPLGERQYYATGFGATVISAMNCGPDGIQSCARFFTGNTNSSCNNSQLAYNATAKANASAAGLATNANLILTNMNMSSFTAESAGQISTTQTAFDLWTITEESVLTNTSDAL